MPTTAFATPCPSTPPHGNPKCASPSSSFSPMKITAWMIVLATNVTNRGSGPLMMNCVPACPTI